MRVFLKILLLSLYSSLSIAQCLASLEINTNNPGASIYLDGEFLGKGRTLTDVEKGTHVILILKNIIEWNTTKFTDTITISDCSNIVQAYRFDESEIYLDTNPQNAAIFSENRLLGYTPFRINSAGINQIELKKQNYRSKLITLKNAEIQKNINLELMYETSDLRFVESNEFLYLMGSTVALGISAAYFKLQADKKYDEYTNSLDNSLLDETDRLDIYSGISTTLLQINLGYIVYRLVTD